ALFVYDFIITFGDEVNLFWLPRRLNGPSILFLLNRYLALAVQIIGSMPNPASLEVCPNPHTHTRWPTNIVDYGNLFTVTVVARSSLIGAELIVLSITWYRTRETIKISKRIMAGQDRQTFASTLLRDGGSYHRLTLLIVNSLNIAFSLTSVSPIGAPRSLQHSPSLTSILISRFLINLQKVKHTLEGSSRSMSELAFQSRASLDVDGFIGSLGAQLPFLDDHVNEGDDWPLSEPFDAPLGAFTSSPSIRDHSKFSPL
ncbi:hypothetical protein BD311DRAFT_661383, partial [Dichomitus squalens]